MKAYLGDGAYGEIKDGELILTCENGVSVYERIVLDSAAWTALCLLVDKYLQSKERIYGDGGA